MLCILQFKEGGIRLETAIDSFQGYTFHFEWEVAAQEWQGYSFPSGHSSNSAILYGSLPMYKKNNKALLVVGFVAPFLVGLSRVMLGAHYITDVLFGWAFGALVLFLVSYLQRRVKREWLLHLVIAIVCIPGFFYCQTSDYYISYGMMIGYFLANAFEKRFVNFIIPRTRYIVSKALLYHQTAHYP